MALRTSMSSASLKRIMLSPLGGIRGASIVQRPASVRTVYQLPVRDRPLVGVVAKLRQLRLHRHQVLGIEAELPGAESVHVSHGQPATDVEQQADGHLGDDRAPAKAAVQEAAASPAPPALIASVTATENTIDAEASPNTAADASEMASV
jgi:hypothetical protein